MKLRAIYNQLTEGLSKILYHRTSVWKVLSILDTNEFHLTSTIGSKADKRDVSKGRFYFFSTARSLTSGYFRGGGAGYAFLTLDGDKLGQRYKGHPIDYWQYDMNPETWSSPEQYDQALQSKELEDRIISDKPIIPNAIQYIKEISIMMDSKYENELKSLDVARLRFKGMSDDEIDKLRGNKILKDIPPKDASRYRKLIILANKNNIPVYFYLNFSDLKSHNTKNSEHISSAFLRGTPDFSDKPYISRTDGGGRIEFLVKGYYAKNANELDLDTQEYMWRIANQFSYGSFYRDDMLSSIGADIHNRRSDDNKWVKALTRILQKEKFKSVEQLMTFLADKYKGIEMR